jgi:hypothetical protein
LELNLPPFQPKHYSPLDPPPPHTTVGIWDQARPGAMAAAQRHPTSVDWSMFSTEKARRLKAQTEVRAHSTQQPPRSMLACAQGPVAFTAAAVPFGPL